MRPAADRHGDDHGGWPAVLDGPSQEAACFEEVQLGRPAERQPVGKVACLDVLQLVRVEPHAVAGRGEGRRVLVRVGGVALEGRDDVPVVDEWYDPFFFRPNKPNICTKFPSPSTIWKA